MEGSTDSEGSSSDLRTMRLNDLIELTENYEMNLETLRDLMQIARNNKDIFKELIIKYLEDHGYPHEGVAEGGNQGGKKKKPKKKSKKRSSFKKKSKIKKSKSRKRSKKK